MAGGDLGQAGAARVVAGDDRRTGYAHLGPLVGAGRVEVPTHVARQWRRLCAEAPTARIVLAGRGTFHLLRQFGATRWVSEQGEAFQSVKTRFGASKCVSERQNAFRSVKMRFGASKCVSVRQNAFRSVKMRFGASKCISERQNAFRSVKMRFGAWGCVGICSASNSHRARLAHSLGGELFPLYKSCA